MELKSITSRAVTFLKKYKYAVIVLVIGIILMTLPDFSASNKAREQEQTETIRINRDLEEELSQMLSKVEGAGRVEVVLTVAQGEEKIYQMNVKQDHTETVILTDCNRNENGLVARTDPEKYLGAVVICQGANSASVQYAIIEAVSKITGLKSNQICVLKMK